MPMLCQRVGIEVELLAPAGSDRRQLAEHIAHRVAGRIEPCFHIDSEPSKVQGKPVFYHLTQAYKVLDAQGKLLVHCVDDITLQRDLDKKAVPRSGWYRILSDDIRLLRLLERHTDPDADITQCLMPLGTLFGTEPQATPQGVYRLLDHGNASIALAAPLPGERERACELVTAPLAVEDRTTLPLLLDCARELGFTLPNEGATHLHFDAEPFCSAGGLASTMQLLQREQKTLRTLLRTNPYCRRLGNWPDELMQVINADGFNDLPWEEARLRLRAQKPSKYCDVNIRNLVNQLHNKNTLEIRHLPATLDSRRIFAALEAFQLLFAHTLNPANWHSELQLPTQVIEILSAAH